MKYQFNLTEDQCRTLKEAYVNAYYKGKPTPPEPYDELRHNVADLMECVDIPVHCAKTINELESLIASHNELASSLRDLLRSISSQEEHYIHPDDWHDALARIERAQKALTNAGGTQP